MATSPLHDPQLRPGSGIAAVFLNHEPRPSPARPPHILVPLAQSPEPPAPPPPRWLPCTPRTQCDLALPFLLLSGGWVSAPGRGLAWQPPSVTSLLYFLRITHFLEITLLVGWFQIRAPGRGRSHRALAGPKAVGGGGGQHSSVRDPPVQMLRGTDCFSLPYPVH